MLTCPHCQVAIQRIEIVEVPLTVERQQVYRGVSYTCPRCEAILGVAAHPVQMRDEIAEIVIEKLKGWATGPR